MLKDRQSVLYIITGAPTLSLYSNGSLTWFRGFCQCLESVGKTLNINEHLKSVVKTFIMNRVKCIQDTSHPEKTCRFRPQNHKLSLFTQVAVYVSGVFIAVCAELKTHLKVHTHLQVCSVSYPSPRPDMHAASSWLVSKDKHGPVPAQKGDVFEKRCKEAAQKRQRAPGNVFVCQRPS